MNYKRIYNELIEKHGTTDKPKDIYTENHHIVPRCIGGKDTPENLVYLNARCHLLAHWLLVRILPHNHEITHAFSMMCLMKNSRMERIIPPLHILAEARERKAKHQSKKLKGSKIEFNSDDSTLKRIETAMRNGSYRGLNNGTSQSVDVYNYFSGELVASGVSVTEWGRENDVKRNLNRTLYADRNELSSSTNRHHAKGYYIVIHGHTPYPPNGGTYAGIYSNQGHIGRIKKRKSGK